MRVVIALAAVVVSARPSDACTTAFTRAIVGAPTFQPPDAVTIASETVEVVCDERYVCTVTSTFGIAVTRPAVASVTGHETSSLALRVQRLPLAVTGDSPTVELEPGDTELTLHARAELPEFIDGCFTDGVISRHPVFGARPRGNERILQIDTTATPRVHKPAAWDLDVDPHGATKYGPASTRLWFRVPGQRITHGGPFALLGVVSGSSQRVHFRGGWEFAVGPPWLVFAIAGETDYGPAWNVALTVEPTTRASMLPLTLGAGIGIVLANGEAGARGQISIALGPARFLLSTDVIFAGEVTAGGWLGVSL